jgi:transposase InsO family protein
VAAAAAVVDLDEDMAGPAGNVGVDTQDKDQDLDHLIKAYRYVPKHAHAKSTNADIPETSRIRKCSSSWTRLRRVDHVLVTSAPNDIYCAHNKDFALCDKCKGKGTRHSTPWLLDSGASRHYTCDLNDFVLYTSFENTECLKTATSDSWVAGGGTVIIRVPMPNGKTQSITISSVCYVPDLNTHLLSLGTFLQDDMKIEGDKHQICLTRQGKMFMAFNPQKPGNTLFGVNMENFVDEMANLSAINSIDHDIMHQRYAHPSYEVLKHARKHVGDFPDVVFHQQNHICAGCAMGKMSNLPYTPSDKRTERPFELIHSDLKSYSVASYHNFCYVMTFLDDHSGCAWITLLKEKKGAAKAARQFIEMVKTQHNAAIKRWRCDQGGEYISDVFINVLKDEGIKLLPSPPYTLQVNGRAERFMRTMTKKADAMRHHSGIPDTWWEFAVKQAVCVYNVTPLKRCKWKTPHEVVHKSKPSINHLQVFGCGAYVFRPKDTRKTKMLPRSELMMYLGWGGSGHQFMTQTGSLKQMPHAIFDDAESEETYSHLPGMNDDGDASQSSPYYPKKGVDVVHPDRGSATPSSHQLTWADPFTVTVLVGP